MCECERERERDGGGGGGECIETKNVLGMRLGRWSVCE